MPQEDDRSRLDVYSRRAMRYRGYRGSELESRVREVRQIVARMERDDPGLTQRIEDKLADRALFRGSDEQRALLMAVASVAGHGCTRPGRMKGQPLDNWDLAGDDADDPAVIAERRDLRDALEREIRGPSQTRAGDPEAGLPGGQIAGGGFRRRGADRTGRRRASRRYRGPRRAPSGTFGISTRQDDEYSTDPEGIRP